MYFNEVPGPVTTETRVQWRIHLHLWLLWVEIYFNFLDMYFYSIAKVL